VIVESVLERPVVSCTLVHDVLHTPTEFERCKTRFPAFFDSLFTTTTTTTSIKASRATCGPDARSLTSTFSTNTTMRTPASFSPWLSSAASYFPSSPSSFNFASTSPRRMTANLADEPEAYNQPQTIGQPEQQQQQQEPTAWEEYNDQLGDMLQILDLPRSPFPPF
jgi:hypothetical protein